MANIINVVSTAGPRKWLSHRASAEGSYYTHSRDRSSVYHGHGKICGLLSSQQCALAAATGFIMYLLMLGFLYPDNGETAGSLSFLDRFGMHEPLFEFRS